MLSIIKMNEGHFIIAGPSTLIQGDEATAVEFLLSAGVTEEEVAGIFYDLEQAKDTETSAAVRYVEPREAGALALCA